MLLHARGQNDRHLEDARCLGEHQSIALELFKGHRLGPTHGADLVVDQQEGRVVSTEILILHCDSPSSSEGHYTPLVGSTVLQRSECALLVAVYRLGECIKRCEGERPLPVDRLVERRTGKHHGFCSCILGLQLDHSIWPVRQIHWCFGISQIKRLIINVNLSIDGHYESYVPSRYWNFDLAPWFKGDIQQANIGWQRQR
ncbi:hypothetical protein D3C79_851430 [compost metagenome]